MFRIAFFLLILSIIAVGAGGYWVYQHHLTTPLPLYTDLHYTVEPNTTLSEIAIDLMAQELLDYPSAFLWVSLARLQKRAHLIKAGEYLIPKNTTPQQFLNILIAGKTIQYTLTIPEGWNFRQIMAAVRKHPQLVQTLGENDDDATIMAKLGKANQHPEGRFYPDTYHFPKETTDIDFLQRAYKMMETEVQAVWEKRSEDIPLKNAEEALILASLIEKETGVPEERPIIAGVFTRRLQKNMRLETDPTVIYALGDAYKGNIHKQDLKIQNPYNTYVNKGLPPTPIAAPGRAALYAAVNPTQGEALYFVAKGDGSHYFSNTYQEHLCAIIQYQLKKDSQRYQIQCKKHPNCVACRH